MSESKQDLRWCEPLVVASYINSLNIDFIFFYSSLLDNCMGRYSYLAFGVKKKFNDFSKFNDYYTNNKNDKWFGYFSYELKNEFEFLPKTLPSFIKLPNFYIACFNNVIVFDHYDKTIKRLEGNFEIPDWIINQSCNFQYEPPQVLKLMSNMTKKSYYKYLDETIEAIKRGDFYQANITRKFFGYLKEKNENHFSIFCNLCRVSPAAYSAFLKIGQKSIISSSPEMFLKIDNNIVETRPIKGSAPTFQEKYKNEQSKSALLNSEKDKAENLMIVDLMRNDLSKGCIAGTVNVPEFYRLYSYSNIHHMVSVISGCKRPNVSVIEFIKNCFPPGSVTGAPKIQAMKWCSAVEKFDRGVYCGGIGWLDRNNAHFSVAIRILIMNDNKFEFQVGSGIVIDSVVENEWQETLIKAKGIAAVLGISFDQLQSL